MHRIVRSLWLFAALFGVVYIAAGAFFIYKSVDAKNQIQAGLLEEQIVTGKDAAVPGLVVQDATSAKMEADVIKLHTLGKNGPYTKMASDDPNRTSYLSGVSLRTALMLAATGWGVADMAMGSGLLFIMTGAMVLFVLVPALYWARDVEKDVVEAETTKVARGALAHA